MTRRFARLGVPVTNPPPQSGFVRKSEIVKRKNDEEIEEYWVQCDCCEGWVHQICGLFNKGRNNANSTYLCPDCLRRVRAQGAGRTGIGRVQLWGRERVCWYVAHSFVRVCTRCF